MNKIKKAYRQSQLEGMSPGRITLMLFDGALGFIEAAREASLKGDVPFRGDRASRALAIIGELQATLNMEEGGDVASNLMRLYDYLIREILKANLRDDPELFAHLSQVLGEIRTGWEQMLEELEQEGSTTSADGPRPEAAGQTGTYA